MLREWMKEKGEERALGVVSPHAGYAYSGHVAGAVFSRIAIPKNVLILNPNHHGWGEDFALAPSGVWETPLGDVEINERLNRLLLEMTAAEEDERAHYMEHSGELQLPFLKFRRDDVSVSLVCIACNDIEKLLEFGKSVAEVVRRLGEDVLIVASSDMTHYEPAEVAKRKDYAAIERMEALDTRGLWNVVKEQQISMCGVGPVTAMMEAAKSLGAKQARLIKYATSGDVTGDFSQVVGYASLLVR